MTYVSTTRGLSLADRFGAYRGRLREARAKRELYNRTLRELSLLTDRDLADIGISRYAIEDLAHEHAYGRR